MGVSFADLSGGMFGDVGSAIQQGAAASTPCTPDPATWPNAYEIRLDLNVTYAPHLYQTQPLVNSMLLVTPTGANTQYTITNSGEAQTVTNLQYLTDTQLAVNLRNVYGAGTQQQNQQWQQLAWTNWQLQAVNNGAQGGADFGNALARDEPRSHLAKKTADELLREHLTEAQRAEMDAHRYFTVIGKHSRRKYQIRTDRERHGNIILLGDDGHADASLCAAPMGGIPIGDALLGQKLMLESAEEEFLRIANSTPLRRVG